MCRFAQVFPPGVRTPGLSVAAHLKAGNPETVGAVIDALEKAPEDITVKDVRDFLEQRKLERERNNRAAHDKLKDRPPTSDLAYLDRLNRYFAAIAKASELVDTSMPKPKSDSDRQRIRNALTEVIDKCNKKLAAA
jgi:hypothetical protein